MKRRKQQNQLSSNLIRHQVSAGNGNVLVMKSGLICILMSYAILSFGYSDYVLAGCIDNCVTDFGVELGITASGVKAYSNCNNSCVALKAKNIETTFTGLKWQCVEFARRWLLLNHAYVFDSVDTAADMWEAIQFYISVEDDTKLIVQSHENGSEIMPARGDLFIYKSELFGTGHVAVVTAVDKNKQLIFLAEQNYKNEKWSGDAARTVRYINKENKIKVLDKHLIGWKRAVF